MADPFSTYQRITGGGTYQDLLDSITRANYSNLTPVQPAGLESLIDTYTFGLTPTFGSFPSLEESFGALEDVDITDEYGDADIDDMNTSGNVSKGIGSLNLGNLTAKDIALGLALGVPGIVGLVSKATTGKTISQHVIDLGRSMLGMPSGKTFGIEDDPSDFGGGFTDSPGMGFGSGMDDPSLDPGDSQSGPSDSDSGLSAPTSGPPGVGPGESGGPGNDGNDGGGVGGEAGGDSGDTGGPFAEGGIVRRRFR